MSLVTSGLRWTAAAFLACSYAILSAGAQTLDDDIANHGMGALPLSDAEIAASPRAPVHRNFVPERADLSSRMPAVGNQGRQGSCVGWAVAYAARSYYVGAEGRSLSSRDNIPSPAFLYNAIKPPGDCDTGSNVYQALTFLKRRGVLSLRDYPYSETQCSAVSSIETDKFKIDEFQFISTAKLDQIKAELAKGNPLVFSMPVTRAFHRLKGSEVYRYPDAETGLHAMTLVGYDDRRHAFKLINSWGTRWGENGFGWVDYEVFSSGVKGAYVMRVSTPIAPQPDPAPPPIAPKPDPAPNIVVVPPPQPVPAPSPIPAPIPVVVTPPAAPEIAKCELVRGSEVNGKRTLTGFVGTDERLRHWKDDPANSAADIRIVVRPWPQCEALLLLDKNMTRGDRPAVMIRRASGDTLNDGEALILEVQTPPFPSYLHIAYVQADGSVLNLVQSDAANIKMYPPNSRIILGDGSNGGPRYKVSAPFGREMLIAVAAKAPLFSETRPSQEIERDFLTALRLALVAKPDPSMPDRDVAANIDAIVTRKRAP